MAVSVRCEARVRVLGALPLTGVKEFPPAAVELFHGPAHFMDDAGNVLGNVSASVLLIADGVSAYGPVCFERFGATSGALMVHPYLRETIASMAQRIGFPGILLPMMTYQPDTPNK